MALVEDIGSALTTASVVEGGTGWTLAYGWVPPDPDQVMVITETGGVEPSNETGDAHNFREFQLFARAASHRYDLAETQIQAAFVALHAQTITGYIYVYAKQSGPFLIGYDQSDRPELTWNFRTMEVR